MKKWILASLLIPFFAFAETTTYSVEGMHCGSCAKAIEAQVCKADGLEKCSVSLGQVVITPKAGIHFSQEQIQSLVSKAGDYKVTGAKNSK
jgi:copper chaperone CopZ